MKMMSAVRGGNEAYNDVRCALSLVCAARSASGVVSVGKGSGAETSFVDLGVIPTIGSVRFTCEKEVQPTAKDIRQAHEPPECELMGGYSL